jgi:hypothetical protein
MSDTAKKLAQKSSSPSSTAQVRLTLRYISVASVAKISFIVGVVLAIVGVIAAMILFGFLSVSGAISQLDSLIGSALGSSSTSTVSSIATPGIVFAVSAGTGVLTIIGSTLGGIIGALLYNASVRGTNGLLVGFTNR